MLTAHNKYSNFFLATNACQALTIQKTLKAYNLLITNFKITDPFVNIC